MSISDNECCWARPSVEYIGVKMESPDNVKLQTPVAIARTLWILLVVSIVFSLMAVSVRFHSPIYDFHGFRQTQTAISAYSILHGGSFLHYETPVLGPPWLMPFEFPLYQGIVAAIVKVFSTPLEETGRFVSLLFYYACFFPLMCLLRRAGLRGVLIVPPLALFAVSPLYIFISRLFMIESTALFFSLMYADQMVRLVTDETRWSRWHIVGASCFGILAGLVKVTTFAPFFVAGVSVVCWQLWKDCKAGRLRVGPASAAATACGLLPIGVTWGWTQYADGEKARNPFGFHLTSKGLSAWNYGTLAQRLRPRSYGHFLIASNNQIGSLFAVAVVIVAFIVQHRRWNWFAVACLTLYAGTIELFFNLHYVHEYYPYSNCVLLIAAVGALIGDMLRLPGRKAWIGVGLLVLMMTSCMARYCSHYYRIQTADMPGRPHAAAIIDRTTREQDIIMVTGVDWSSEFPYQSRRRAITDPTYAQNVLIGGVEPIDQSIANAGAHNVAALVACDNARRGPRLDRFLIEVGMRAEQSVEADGCTIYERGAALSVLKQ